MVLSVIIESADVLENYARGQHLTNIRHYIDDDESGRFFDRSAYSRMMDDIQTEQCALYRGQQRDRQPEA